MCGRFTHLYTWRELHRLMSLTTPQMDLPLRYNVAPTQRAPVVRPGRRGIPPPVIPPPVKVPLPDLDDSAPAATGRELALLQWGLVPFWSREPKSPASMINARAEGIADKPAFRAAIRSRRCLVPVSGFYEWKRTGAAKQPYYFTSAGGEPLVFAGLWERWKPRQETGDSGTEGARDASASPASPPGSSAPRDPGVLETFTIITTTPNEMMREFHDRMPVILDAADFDRWLDPRVGDPSAVVDLLKPYPAELMLATPVSTRVNSPKNDDEGCIRAQERETLF